MPHTGRGKKSKPKPSRKLVSVASEDGWSTVSRKCDVQLDNDELSERSRSWLRHVPIEQLLERLTLDQAAALRIGGAANMPRPRKAQVSEKELSRLCDGVRRAWTATKANEQMRALFEFRIPARCFRDTGKLVCLGLGSPSTAFNLHGSSEAWQLAVFLSLADHTRTVNGKDVTIDLYAQDPVFNDVDCSLLRSLGIQILENPSAFGYIDHDTIVFAPHYPVAAWSEAMRRGNCSLILGNDVVTSIPQLLDEHAWKQCWGWFNSQDDHSTTLAVDAKRELEDFAQKHVGVGFPVPEEGAHALNALMFYWKACGPEQGD